MSLADPVFGPPKPDPPQPALLGITMRECQPCQVKGREDRCWCCGRPW